MGFSFPCRRIVVGCDLIVGALVGSACLTAVRKTNKGGVCANGMRRSMEYRWILMVVVPPGQAARTSLMLVFEPTCLRTLE